MIFSEKLRDVVRMITTCGKGGLYKPTNRCSETGLPVIGLFRAKHPGIRFPDLDDEDQAQAFSDYLLIDDPVPIFCYKDYVSRIVPKLSVAAGLCGVGGETLNGWLLRHMVHSDALCE